VLVVPEVLMVLGVLVPKVLMVLVQKVPTGDGAEGAAVAADSRQRDRHR
jgi:hypothetical protein